MPRAEGLLPPLSGDVLRHHGSVSDTRPCLKNVKTPKRRISFRHSVVVELLSWWAMDVRCTSFETRDIPPEQAKAVCLDNLMAAYALG